MQILLGYVCIFLIFAAVVVVVACFQIYLLVCLVSGSVPEDRAGNSKFVSLLILKSFLLFLLLLLLERYLILLTQHEEGGALQNSVMTSRSCC